IPAVQDYCSQLLARALEAEQIHQKVAEFEAKRGPLKGLKEIAEDPDYLAEWQARSEAKPELPTAGGIAAHPPAPSWTRPGPVETATVDLVLADGDETSMDPSTEEGARDV